MTVSIHGTLTLGLGDSARLRTEIGELSVARKALRRGAGRGTRRRLRHSQAVLKAATGDSYVLVLPCAELADHRLASAEARGQTPD